MPDIWAMSARGLFTGCPTLVHRVLCAEKYCVVSKRLRIYTLHNSKKQ